MLDNTEKDVASEFHSKERFSNRVANYLETRPRYPESFRRVLRDETGLTAAHIIADIGSGTGFSAELFLQNGNDVFGIEPNREMRGAGELFLRRYPRFKSVDGTAEATGLPDASVDYILAGQAFHWFDPEMTRREFLRILRSGGWVVLFWNNRRTASTAFLRDYENLLNEYGTDYSKVRDRGEKLISEAAQNRGEIMRFFAGDVKRHTLPNEQQFDLRGLTGRLLSSSYVPVEGSKNYGNMIRRLAKIFAEHQKGGKVVFEYDLEVFMGHLAGDGRAG